MIFENFSYLRIGLYMIVTILYSTANFAQSEILFKNVRVFNGADDKLSEATDVLIVNNKIKAISKNASKSASSDVEVIEGDNRVLMPGLMDAHTHVAWCSTPQQVVLNGRFEYVQLRAAKELEKMLMRGITAVRDMSGNSFSLKKVIDEGMYAGPRIYPSGPMISQTSGHGDFRMPNQRHPKFGGDTPQYILDGNAVIADDPGDIKAAARNNLFHGASQIKMAAGGGYASPADPLETVQYTVEELRAGVEAAEGFGTYVAVHVYTVEGINNAIDAGVKSIEHGQLTDKATLERMAKEGVWLSTQPFTECHEDQLDEFSNSKLAIVCEGTKKMYQMLADGIPGLKVAYGTDLFFVPQDVMDAQLKQMERLLEWFTPAQILTMATKNNGELFKLAGDLRDSYPGKIGVVEEGALADLLLVEGNPLKDLTAVTNQDNLLIIMKDGKIYKNTLE